jgi:hypothetical protein
MIFKDKEVYSAIKTKNLINKKLIAETYSISEGDIPLLDFFDDVKAIKVTLKRRVTSGAPGDSDVLGMNQEGPLLYINFRRDLLKRGAKCTSNKTEV